MEKIKCEICGKLIDRVYRKKDYGVYTHYFSNTMERKHFCSGCLYRIEEYFVFFKKSKKEEFLKKHPEYKYFNYLGQDRETRVPFYSLKKKLEKQTWDKISDLFYFCGYSSDDDKKEPPDSARGRWVTHDPKKIIERLGWN